ncbi:universal stress protein [Rathayibacter oskolensis]|uniref:universal stress protein n=1 Tax=Rathayibacter oskolensis TaxID=1891671 RepID=UPI00265ED400|nr:universal stress protein [Rathayibacter oskolensis]WKK71146.1 universal stress protein [Rathayibacter oskolensis]
MVAAAEAARRGETLHLVHAWTEPALYDRAFLLDEEFLRSLETEHRRILDAAGLIASTSGFEGRIETHLVGGDPVRALAEVGAAMIVIGTRGLSGWRRLLLGSVGRGLVLNLGVPLIVVAHPEAAQPIARPARDLTVTA